MAGLASPQAGNFCYSDCMHKSDLEWKATWICSGLVGGPGTSVAAPLMRREFKLAGAVKSATLHITALGLYQCSLNGERVGDEALAPGWTDTRKRVAYQSFEVGELLKPGANAIGVILGDGWYCGHLGGWHRQTHGDRPELLAQLEIVYEDGKQELLVTDGSWQWKASPIVENDLLQGESYDARLEQPGWDLPGDKAEGWQAVELRGEKDIQINRSDAPPIRRQEELPAKEIRSKRLARIYDLSQNFTGRVRIRVKGPRGSHFKIRHAEMLQDDGELYTTNLRSALCTDQYTARGDEDGEIWEPLFTFHGFRFVEVFGVKEDCSCEVTGIVLNSDMRETGSFSCSNPLLNQLWSNIRWGMKSNFLDVPTDCPQRDERMGWTGDAQVFARTAASFMDVKGFFDKWLLDVQDAQQPNGAIPKVIPNVGHYTFNDDGGPAWADAAIIVPWTMYLCYGDSTVLKNNYACMKRYMDYVAKHRLKDHVRSHPDVHEWGGFGDWLDLDKAGTTPKDLIGTALHANNADIMAQSAALLGKDNEAQQWNALYQNLVAAFQRRFITADGLVMGGTQTAYVLALHFGLVPEGLQSKAMAELVRHIESNGFHIATGFVGTPYILDVLEAGGRLDLAYTLLEQETFPSWLFPLKNGATTIWERWDGWTPEKGFQDAGMNSFNHYAYGAVGAWMLRSVAGIDLDPAEPGFAHILFRPRPGGTLTHARASLSTPHGDAAIEWNKEAGKVRVEITMPEGARGTFSPPGESGLKEKELGSGVHGFEW
jgi:alpha-L-rhamnosidase